MGVKKRDRKNLMKIIFNLDYSKRSVKTLLLSLYRILLQNWKDNYERKL